MSLGPLELLGILLMLALIVVPIVVVVLAVNRSSRKSNVPPVTAQAGWWPDPGGAPGVLRYFDGQRWTDETRHLDPPTTQ